jgi:lipoate-protein ligase A
MNGCSSARLAARPSGAAIIRSASTHPWRNLALEEHLALRIRPGQAILYLWRNRPSVVIGRNQNPWQECRLDLLARDGALLARRPSGGGAVYHDLGNLNFTFIVSRELYDLDRQLALVLAALHSLGVPAQLSQRKDLLVGPYKISGSAIWLRAGFACHHGTLLINSDLDRLHRYLHPAAQVATRSIQSVRSPVTNLSHVRPGLDVETASQALIHAFADSCGTEPCAHKLDPDSMPELDALLSKHASWQWQVGECPHFDASFKNTFSWGDAQLHLTVHKGTIERASLTASALHPHLAARLSAALTALPMRQPDVSTALARASTDLDTAESAVLEDISRWLSGLLHS